jgi:hypothetical protein
MSNSKYKLDAKYWKVSEVEVFDRRTAKTEKMPKHLAPKDKYNYDITDTYCDIIQYEGLLMQGMIIVKRLYPCYADTSEEAQHFYQEDLARLPKIIQEYEQEEQQRIQLEEARRQAEINYRFSKEYFRDILEEVFGWPLRFAIFLKSHWICISICALILFHSFVPEHIANCGEYQPAFPFTLFSRTNPDICHAPKETE